MRSTRLVPLLLVTATACGSNLGIRWDEDPTEEGLGAVLVAPNLDDDDENGEVDWASTALVVGENDLAKVTIDNGRRPTRLQLENTNDRVRVYYNGATVLGPGAGEAWTLPDRKRSDTITVQVEVQTWGKVGSLVVVDERKEEIERVEIIGSAPTMGHHLLPTEEVYVVDINYGGGWTNQVMVDQLTEILGDMLVVAPGTQYGQDPWMQDEPEWLGAWTPEAESILILDSIRDGNGEGGLDPFPETFAGVDASVQTLGSPNEASTFDAFGNLEVSPPVTVDGIEYPFGRIYYGWDGVESSNFEYGPNATLRQYLDDLGAQAPFYVDTSWLCVGHVDEFTSFLPDPTAPRGFRFLIADTGLGVEAMRTKPEDTATGRHASRRTGHGRPTFGSYYNDDALVAYNEDIQRLHIEPQLEIFRTELGLLDEEIVRVPAFFEEEADRFGVCGAAAVIPGSVNLLMVTDETGEGGIAVMADPFLRPDDAPPEDDPFLVAWTEAMPAGVRPEFVDDWDIYHMALGEVHCGTNQERTPAASTVDLQSWIEMEVAR